MSLNGNDFEKMDILQKELSCLNLEKLSKEEKIFLNQALIEIEKKIHKKKSEIIKSIEEKEKEKRFI